MGPPGWSGPTWGEPSTASQATVPLRSPATAADCAYRAEGGSSENFSVMGASVVGVGHRLAGRRCDDAFGWALVAPNILFLVVADGVSNAPHGGEGAELAVKAACRSASSAQVQAPPGPEGQDRERFGTMVCLDALISANEVVFAAAQDMGVGPRELSTTLVAAVLTLEEGRALVDLTTVGDSAAFVLGSEGWTELGREGQEEGMRDSGTTVLPGPEPQEVEGVGIGSFELGPGEILVLMTDGVSDPLREGPTTVAPGLASVLAEAYSGRLTPLGLALAADFGRRGCQDDRTVLAAWALQQVN